MFIGSPALGIYCAGNQVAGVNNTRARTPREDGNRDSVWGTPWALPLRKQWKETRTSGHCEPPLSPTSDCPALTAVRLPSVPPRWASGARGDVITP